MVKKIVVINLLSFLFLISAAYAETANVITRENAIRKECRFFSPIKAIVKYNDELQIISQEGDWFHVKFGNIAGCIHKSAIRKKSFSLSGLLGTEARAASSNEVALAGKGFNPQVESSYKQKHPELDFRTVDRIENYNVPGDKLKAFIKSGGLKLP
ncbi:hypothetical protein BMS3Abin07_00628 [bacterium BMS3Abin07]|nr:hypothetical protein BMS3Abin07_00628 [bacterium BMS3Abin07]GBE32797.1 hypothetical protein BMS3Bbin05_01720 [bacterium BMS3Bbin05]HDL20910.1 hypothetical protein [Nitrospirota bacterium]HDO21780.1 hypothetical protein [Nitrospirota bacterium]HDZ88991.1 hypothetical protein [Nitrospirota bacterium]